jgi:hypothetical protein
MSRLAGRSKPGFIVAIGLAVFLLAVAAAVALVWAFAPRVAGWLLPRDTSPTETSGMSLLLATAIPEVAYWIAFVQRSTKMNPDGFNPSVEMYSGIVLVAAQLVVGLTVQRIRGMRSMTPSK